MKPITDEDGSSPVDALAQILDQALENTAQESIRQRATAALEGIRKQEQERVFYAELVGRVRDAIIVTDTHLDAPGPHIRFVNPAFTRLTGYSSAEALGKSPRILQGPQTRKESTSALRHALQEGRSFQCEVENYRADGERYWLEIGVSIMDSPLLPEKMFVAVERDITHRKFMEDELRTAKAREERDRALTKQRLDSAALRLRGPVHQLTGAFELLSESVQAGEPTDELVMGMFAEHLAILEECIQSMEEPEAPEQERESRGVHLSELCSGSLARVQHPALLRGIGLQFEQVGSEGRVAGRYGELLDAFGRILDNAVRVSPVGGRVTMTAVQSGACFEISTVDEGPGFSLQDRQRAFEDFYQGEHASAEGHGLGLGRCREVVEALGGEVWIDSEHSPGARIVVALPTSLHQEPPQPTL